MVAYITTCPPPLWPEEDVPDIKTAPVPRQLPLWPVESMGSDQKVVSFSIRLRRKKGPK